MLRVLRTPPKKKKKKKKKCDADVQQGEITLVDKREREYEQMCCLLVKCGNYTTAIMKYNKNMTMYILL